MTHLPRSRVVPIVGVVSALLVGCATSDGGSARPAPPAPAPPPSVAPVEALPTLAVRVGDPVEAQRRLDAAVHRLFEHPDPALLHQVAVPGTDTYARWERQLRALRRAHLGYAEPGSRIVDVRVATDTPELVYLRVTYRDTVAQLVEPDGRVREERAMDPESTWIVILQPYRLGFRIASATPALGDVEVRL